MMLGMQQRDAKSAPQEIFSSTRQLPVRAALNAQIPTLPLNCCAEFTAHELLKPAAKQVSTALL